MFKKLIYVGMVLLLLVPGISMAMSENNTSVLEKLIEVLKSNIITDCLERPDSNPEEREKREDIRVELIGPVDHEEQNSKDDMFRYRVNIYRTENPNNRIGSIHTQMLPDCTDPDNGCNLIGTQLFITDDEIAFVYEITYNYDTTSNDVYSYWFWTVADKNPPFTVKHTNNSDY